MGRIFAKTSEKKPIDVVNDVKNVAHRTSLKAIFSAVSFSFPFLNSSRYFVKRCTKSDIPTTNIIVGSITIKRSNDFPVNFIMANVHIIATMITSKGINIPHQLRKEMYKKMINRQMALVMKIPSSFIIFCTK